MRRVMVFLAVFSLCSLIGTVAAQGVPTPPGGVNPGGQPTATVAAPGVPMPPGGQPMVIYTSEGAEAAQVTVTEVTDPFEDWELYYDPQVGERYVVITVQVENTGERPFDFDPYSFQLLDSMGRLSTGSFAFRSAAATAAMPNLEAASMLPGESVIGALHFAVPADAQLAQLIYTLYGEVQQLYLVDVTGAPSAPATPGN